jgi:hypothetical protein
MALTYQTEYRLGRRGVCVTRTYGGVRAFVAIAADLTLALIFGAFGLVFGVIGWTLWLAYHLVRLAVLAIRDVVSTLARFVGDVITLPWRLTRMNRRPRAGKPAFASFDEL